MAGLEMEVEEAAAACSSCNRSSACSITPRCQIARMQANCSCRCRTTTSSAGRNTIRTSGIQRNSQRPVPRLRRNCACMQNWERRRPKIRSGLQRGRGRGESWRALSHNGLQNLRDKARRSECALAECAACGCGESPANLVRAIHKSALVLGGPLDGSRCSAPGRVLLASHGV